MIAIDYNSSIDAVFGVARRHESALAVAQAVGDEFACMLVGARLRRALARTELLVDMTSIDTPSRRLLLHAMFRESSRGMRERLDRVPTDVQASDPQRLIRWMLAARPDGSGLEVPDLFEVDSKGVALPHAQFINVYVLCCRLMTELRDARFENVQVARTDFSIADLHSSLWQRSEIRHCCFADSTLIDASFSDVTFLDCDLRGADLAVTTRREGRVMSRVRFVRCDLRGVIWAGRDLSHVSTIECVSDDTGEFQEAVLATHAIGAGPETFSEQAW